MKFVFFKNSEYFDKNKIWNIKDLKRKFPETEISEPVMYAKVYIKVNNGKTIQVGTIISGDEETVLNNYLNLREFNG